MESSSLQELERIPGVGKTIAQDMQNIGIHSIDDLKGTQAEQLYDRLCEFKASPVDRCMLYVFRGFLELTDCKVSDILVHREILETLKGT
jgi:hypothetical protein